MVEEGTWVYIEIGDSELFVRPLPRGVIASAFANRDLYLVLANYNRTPAEIAVSDEYVSVVSGGPLPGKIWNLAPRTFQVLRRA
jgi:hypothetical protein